MEVMINCNDAALLGYKTLVFSPAMVKSGQAINMIKELMHESSDNR